MDHPHECSDPTWGRYYGCYYYYTFSIIWQLIYTAKKLYRSELAIIGMRLSFDTEN